jgi:hypothetical protein
MPALPKNPRRVGRTRKVATAGAPAERGVPEYFADFVDVVTELNAAHARYLIVGAYAMAIHGVPRATGDLDIWVEPTPENARCVFKALAQFGAPLRSLGITPADFATAGRVCQLGLPPRRIDVITAIDGVGFTEGWNGRIAGHLGLARVHYIGREALLRNKLAAGRTKDLADIELLRGSGQR